MVIFFENNKLLINMKISRYILAFSAVGLLWGATSCSNLEEIEDRIDSLESRVQALENVIPALNQNIEALQALAGGGTINKVEEKDGVYTITLSNGETLTINQGAIGVANPPVMSLDKDGYWMVDYGTGAEYLLVDGQKVNATGDNGVTPVFGVDAEGYWTVSYDGGKTFEQVLGADGNPVAAIPQEGADEYFADVVYDGKTFTIVLKDGQTITLPVVPTFFFSIEVEGEQVLQAGETKIYPVKSEGVVSAAVIAKPAGVEVSLDDKSLTVRALGATKAVAADSRKDIAVLALSAEGFATIAKMQVSVEGVAVDTTPRATVAAGEATSYTLAFSVALDNSESYKYMLLAADAEAPTAETILAEGTESTATTLVIENLTPETEYALYVLPLGTEKNGAVATAKATTLAEAVPSVEVAADAATASTLTFTVTLTDGTSYKYMVLTADAEAPTAETLKADGTEATAAELTVEGLEAETSYVLYVLPINGGTLGEVVALAAATAEPSYANDYEKYMAGKDIVIANMTINKAEYGDATLITNSSENKAIGSKGVYFVDSAAEGVTIGGNADQLIVLSLDEKMATVGRTTGKCIYVNASDATDYFVLSNIKYVTDMTSGNMIAGGGNGVIESILFNKVKVEVPKDMLFVYSSKEIQNFNMTDCDVKLHVNSAEKNLVQSNTTNTYETLVFKNNIFYCTDGDLAGYRLFSNNNATIASLEFRNNTIAGVYCKAAYGYVTVKSITAGDVVSNLLYLPNYTTHLDGKYVGILHIADKVDEHLNMPSNLAFYNYDAVPSYRAKVSYYSSNGTIYNKAKADNPIPSPDYTNGIFTQGEDYKSFGAKR